MTSIAIAVQVVAYSYVGAFADYGPYRKRLMMAVSIAGAVITMLGVTLSPSNWWAGGIFVVLIAVTYGAGFIYANSFLPQLAANDPAVQAAAAAGRADVMSVSDGAPMMGPAQH